MAELSTPRLRLTELSAKQLEQCLNDVPAFEKAIGFPVSSEILNDPVPRAINMKLSKMAAADVSQHAWFTYWLIVTKDNLRGIGFIGFKGTPDANGETEIGYGIDSADWNKGYMTEAVQTMLKWAFSHEECRTVVAISVKNPRSERVLTKCGFHKFAEKNGETNWKIDKSEFVRQYYLRGNID